MRLHEVPTAPWAPGSGRSRGKGRSEIAPPPACTLRPPPPTRSISTFQSGVAGGLKNLRARPPLPGAGVGAPKVPFALPPQQPSRGGGQTVRPALLPLSPSAPRGLLFLASPLAVGEEALQPPAPAGREGQGRGPQTGKRGTSQPGTPPVGLRHDGGGGPVHTVTGGAGVPRGG